MRSVFAPTDSRSFRPLTALLLALSLAATACGGGSDGATDDDSSAESSEGASSNDGDSGAASETRDAGGSDDGATGEGVSATIAWTAPDGMDPVEIVMSPDGSRFAIAFAGPVAPEAQPGEIVVFDVASASELWRVSIDDIGILGFELVYTDAGVTNLAATLETTNAITYADGAVVSDVPLDDCWQFLNGAVLEGETVFFTVLPGAVCRVDVSSGATTLLSLEEIAPGAALVNSIRFDADGTLLIAYQDQNFAALTASVDPAGLTVTDPNSGRTEPPSAADRFGSQLDGDVFASSEARAAQSADGSIVALIQSGRVDIIG